MQKCLKQFRTRRYLYKIDANDKKQFYGCLKVTETIQNTSLANKSVLNNSKDVARFIKVTQTI